MKPMVKIIHFGGYEEEIWFDDIDMAIAFANEVGKDWMQTVEVYENMPV